MLGQNQDLIITTAGHYAIPLRDKHILEKKYSNISRWYLMKLFQQIEWM